MDAIEILGGLLGGRSGGGGSGGGGLGGAILGQILKGATASRQPAPQQQQAPQSSGRVAPRGSTRVAPPGDIQQEASELEDLLNVAKNRSQQRAPAPAPAPASVPQSAPRTFPTQTRPQSNSPFQQPSLRPQATPPRRDPVNNAQQQNDDALVLIRAMINAAKSDGEISEAEQQSILERIGNPSQEVINFLREEFSSPLDVREFAWSVPLGLEQKVYTMSLAAIELDANHEAAYLRELAHGLRLAPDVCNQIHQQFGAPEIF